MPQGNTDAQFDEAASFFEQAEQAAARGEYEEAIELYIQALCLAPEQVERGHIKLRELAAKRLAQGGPKPSEEEIKQRLDRGDSPLERMLNAEYLLAKDPTHLPYAEAMLRAAVEGGYRATGKWIADLIFLANKRAKRPSLRLYHLLKDSYKAIGRLDRAIAACESALQLKPDDKDFARELEQLSKKRADTLARRQDEQLEESLEEQAARTGSGEVEATESLQGREMFEEQMDPAVARARDLFARAKQVGQTKDIDYAIELYLQGLRHLPDALEEGHLPLFELALQRQKKGGKKPSMMEKVTRIRGKDPLERMLNAEYLFAKDPNNLSYGGQMLKAAIDGGYTKTAGWLANFLFQQNNSLEKPSFKIYTLLKDCYRALGQFDKALAACQHAVRLKPKDNDLAEELKNLTAEMTMAKGKYDQEGDFRKAIKDEENQEKLHARESIVKSEDYRRRVVEDAREALAKEPDLPANIFNLASVLSEQDEDEAENEAIELLEDAYNRKHDFSFAQRAGQIRIKQLKRKLRQAQSELEKSPNDLEAKKRVEQLTDKLKEVELEHYRKCVENYPTDLQAKYEYAVRLMENKQYDEAIPLFQEAQRDPRHRIMAMSKIGLCFFLKGWYADAVDIFSQAIELHQIKDDSIAKELRYNLARAYEIEGRIEKALEIYRKIAQLDYAYKDVRERVDKLRNQLNENKNSG